MPPYAFTGSIDGIPDTLRSPCTIAPADGTDEDYCEFNAIWDTGATHSAIVQRVVDECGLQPSGKANIFHAGNDEKPDETDTYLVNVGLPGNVVIENIRVSRGGFGGADVLIGMDIIQSGDFAITHKDGKTKFTFQMPPQADIDFVDGQPQPPPKNRQERRAQKRKRPS